MAEARCWVHDAGRLTWGALRDAADYANFLGHTVRVFEGRGILFRDFEFRGDPEGIRIVAATVRRIADAGDEKP